MKTRTNFYVDFRRMAEANLGQLDAKTLPGLLEVLDIIDDQNLAMDAELANRFITVQHLMFSQATSTIVFAAMAAEGFIYDYAAQRLPPSDTKRIKRMSAVEKWEKIPKEITGQRLAPNGPGLRMLRDLVTHRNALVHYKSQEIDPGKEGDPVQFALLDHAREALITLNILAEELEAIDPTSHARARIGGDVEARWGLTAANGVEPW